MQDKQIEKGKAVMMRDYVSDQLQCHSTAGDCRDTHALALTSCRNDIHNCALDLRLESTSLSYFCTNRARCPTVDRKQEQEPAVSGCSHQQEQELSS